MNTHDSNTQVKECRSCGQPLAYWQNRHVWLTAHIVEYVMCQNHDCILCGRRFQRLGYVSDVARAAIRYYQDKHSA